ncbi:hypothetical protein I6Q59_004539 [Salmonella enterica subsp. enterica serovar Mikawasima]|nr:hypothetical protein [Salmonella enterica subsp. enterica serovar Mikawasima]
MKSIKALAACLLFLFSFSARALDADMANFYKTETPKRFKEAEQKYPGNKSLLSFEDYYNKHNPRPETTYNTLLILIQDNLRREPQKKIKKLTIGEICGISSSIRMYAYLTTVTSGVKGFLYKSQGYRDAQRLLMTPEDYQVIIDAFEHLRSDYQEDEARYGIEGTSDKVLDTSANNCAADPITFADNLPTLIANDAVDFSKTEVTYEPDY